MRERDLVGRQGLFIAEGEVVLGHLVRSGRFGLQSVLLANKRVEKLRPLLDQAPPETPVYLALQAVLDQIAGFPMHRGVLAVGRRPAEQTFEVALGSLPPSAMVVLLVGLANHDNMGGMFRNAAAFGASLIVLDPTCCDPLYRKSIRVSVGTALTVPFTMIADLDEAISALKRADFSVYALTPRGELPLNAAPRTIRSAVLLGSEGAGLSPRVLAQATCVRIPIASEVDSLNVATAGALALHHFASGFHDS